MDSNHKYKGNNETGKRDEIEQWMKRNKISIAFLQETHSKLNTREARDKYTWYFSGENGREKDQIGVAIVIDNKLSKYVEDIEPYTDTLNLSHYSPPHTTRRLDI